MSSVRRRQQICYAEHASAPPSTSERSFPAPPVYGYGGNTYIRMPRHRASTPDWHGRIRTVLFLLVLLVLLYINYKIQIYIWRPGDTSDAQAPDEHEHHHKHLTAHRGLPPVTVPSPYTPEFASTRISKCESLYLSECERYAYDEDRILGTAEKRNRALVDLITASIRTGDTSWCFGVRCRPIIEFYNACLETRSNHTARQRSSSFKEQQLQSYRNATRNATSLLDKLAYLITHGYVSPLAVRRGAESESTDFGTSHTLIVFIKTSGIFSNMRCSSAAAPFFKKIASCRTPGLQEQGTARRKKRLVATRGLVKWLARDSELVRMEWMQFFANISRWASRKHIPLDIESVWVEDPAYLRCLSELLLPLDPLATHFKQDHTADAAFEDYVRYSYDAFDGTDCMAVTKYFYPMSLCSWFMNLQHRGDGHDDGDEDPYAHHARVLLQKTLASIRRELMRMGVRDPESHMETEIRFGGCWGILDNKAESLAVLQIEQQSTPFAFLNLHEQMHVHFFAHRKWSSAYSPVEMAFDISEPLSGFETPLAWHSQTNAFYSPYHDTNVFPPGILTPPVYTPMYDSAASAMLVFIIAHEWTHRMQYLFDRGCVVEAYGNDGVHWEENMADVFGLRVAYHTYLDLVSSNQSAPGLDNGCDFFLTYAQMWCSKRPDAAASDDPHSSPKTRVDGVMTLIDDAMRETYLRCFGCMPRNTASCRFRLVR
jgi:hypothetical protein